MQIKSHQQLFDKATKVVESCATQDQAEAAQRYLLLYFNVTRDFENFRLLIDLLNNRIDAIQNK